MTQRHDDVLLIDIFNSADDLKHCAANHPELLTETPDWSSRETFFASLLPIIRLGNAVRKLSSEGRQNFSPHTLEWIEETSELASHYDQFNRIDGEGYNKFFSEELIPLWNKARELAPAESGFNSKK